MNARRGYVLVALGLGLVTLLAVVGALGATGEGTAAAQAGTERATADTVRETLMALYYSTDGANWNDNTGWGTDLPYCEWVRVTCDAGMVTELNMYLNNLSGTIPAELGSLSSLQRLSLGLNNLSGPIPSELGGLSSLIDLSLGINNLSGTIPAELGSLSILSRLNLFSNNLSGPIPAALENLSRLRGLSLDDNPYLTCWQTEAALAWALGLWSYTGPSAVCPFVCLPITMR